MMRIDPIGIYLHFPYCVRKCNYCDFCSFVADDRSEYINALCSEIDSYCDNGISIDTVFFGGGTPSLLTPDEFEKILFHIKKSFDMKADTEFTMEANPGTVDYDKLVRFRELGVNRISFGLQSIHENELKKLGRIHSFDEFLESYQAARAAGFRNINIDLMYGIPEQTIESFSETLGVVSALEPEHISVYGLILEEGTPLYEERESYNFPSEDEECDMYALASEVLSKSGYEHYEVSNYSKPCKHSKHNLKYWRAEEYIGVGLSAHSHLDGVRFGNTKKLSDYITSPGKPVEKEILDKDSVEYEYVMLRTRLAEGFSLSEYKKLFCKDFLDGREKIVSSLTNSGYVKISGDRFFFTEKGMYVGNSLLTQLI